MNNVDVKQNEKNIEENEKCGICHEFNNNNNILLKCGHIYCYNCLKEWYIVLEKQKYVLNYKSRECPYCRKQGDYLKLNENETPLQNIHIEFYSMFEKKKCKGITKSGYNCNNYEKIDGYCHIHCKKK